jgi:hypothetical protein
MSVTSWIIASALFALLSPLIALAALARATWSTLGERTGIRRLLSGA